MPHLDASALESDPDGMAFLQAVIGKRLTAVQPSWRCRGITHRPALAAVGVAFRLLAFVLVVAAIARSHTRRPAIWSVLQP